MIDMRLPDDADLAAHLAARTRAALALADFIGGDAVERVSALLGAAAVLIEREVGAAMAPAALMALIEPTIADWQAPGAGAVQH